MLHLTDCESILKLKRIGFVLWMPLLFHLEIAFIAYGSMQSFEFLIHDPYGDSRRPGR